MNKITKLDSLIATAARRWQLKGPEGIETGFKNEKHRGQWRTTLTTYAAPIWDKRLVDIETDDVLACLKLSRFGRPRPKRRHGYAAGLSASWTRRLPHGLRSGGNPARWRGHLANLLPARQKLTRPHYRAMPFTEVPEFLVRLRNVDGVGARALEFAILTAARTGEVLGARWQELDLEAKVWIVPVARRQACDSG